MTDLPMKSMNPLVAFLRWPIETLRVALADAKLYAEQRRLEVEGRNRQVSIQELAESAGVTLRVPTGDEPITETSRLSATAHAAAERNLIEQLCARAVDVARSEIGKGELPGRNNRGPDIARYCAPHGDGWEWCSGFYGYCFETAAKGMNMKLPFRRSLGAKTQGEEIAKVGRKFDDPGEARPGDALIFHRGITGSYKGHIEILSGTEITGRAMPTIPGNSNPLVCERRRNIYDPKLRFSHFVSLRKHAP